MIHIALLRNAIQKYAWGSKTAIPQLLCKDPDGDPQAELWMGAHPGAPSSVNVDGEWVPLPELIKKAPESLLGSRAAETYSNQLPFLFKVLAAEQPLSIQAHPDARQAKKGFSDETAAGIPLAAATRNYKDVNHKPECICALTPFWALNGFRNVRDIHSYLDKLCPHELEKELSILSGRPEPSALKPFFKGLMTKSRDAVSLIAGEAYRQAKQQEDDDPVYAWVIRLHDAYPDDIGVLAPALLNLILLKPGEALYLSAGRLHAYLEGVGMELMANSDNVLRGGLTPKHVDVPELLNVLKFEETIPEVLKPVQEAPGIRRYITPAEEFVLSAITVNGSMRIDKSGDSGVEILLCLQGKATADDGVGKLTLSKGMSMIVPASVKWYSLAGDAMFYRASVPRPLGPSNP